MGRWRQVICITAAGCISGCTASRGPLVVGSPDPAINLPAMVVAAARHQREEMVPLVEQLDSTDPAVRLFAIRSLAELSGGETLGYRHFDPYHVRLEPMNRWREAVGLAPIVPTRLPTTRPSTPPSTRPATQPVAGAFAEGVRR